MLSENTSNEGATSGLWWNKYQVNHQFDGDGKLIAYDVIALPDATSIESHVTIAWNCR